MYVKYVCMSSSNSLRVSVKNGSVEQMINNNGYLCCYKKGE